MIPLILDSWLVPICLKHCIVSRNGSSLSPQYFTVCSSQQHLATATWQLWLSNRAKQSHNQPQTPNGAWATAA